MTFQMAILLIIGAAAVLAAATWALVLALEWAHNQLPRVTLVPPASRSERSGPLPSAVGAPSWGCWL